MQPPRRHPLTEDHLRAIDRVLEAIPETREYLTACQQCQIEVADLLRALDEQERIARAIKTTFFPHSP